MSQQARRIGLFGGSFDPPHLAHLALASAARDALALDEVLWLPAGRPWQKAEREMASADERAAMVELLLQGQHGFALDRRELARQGLSYTIDTVREIHAEQPEAALFLIIGQDQYAHFDTWREAAELMARITLAVAAREGQQIAPPPLLAEIPHTFATVPLPRMDISSTGIRQQIADHPADSTGALTPLVGAAVARYIDQHRLYRVHTPTTD